LLLSFSSNRRNLRNLRIAISSPVLQPRIPKNAEAACRDADGKDGVVTAIARIAFSRVDEAIYSSQTQSAIRRPGVLP